MDRSCLHNYSFLWEHHRDQRLWEGRDSRGAICREHWCQDLVSQWSHESCVQSLGFIALGSKVWCHQPSSSHSGAEHSSPAPRAGHQAVPPPFWCQSTWLRSKLVLGEAAGQQLDEMFSTCTFSLLSAAGTKSCLSLYCCCSASLPSAPCLPSIAYSRMPTVGCGWRSHHHTFFPKIQSCFGGRWALPSF